MDPNLLLLLAQRLGLTDNAAAAPAPLAQPKSASANSQTPLNLMDMLRQRVDQKRLPSAQFHQLPKDEAQAAEWAALAAQNPPTQQELAQTYMNPSGIMQYRDRLLGRDTVVNSNPAVPSHFEWNAAKDLGIYARPRPDSTNRDTVIRSYRPPFYASPVPLALFNGLADPNRPIFD